MDEPGDYELMERTRNGDPDAFAGLIRRHQQSLLNFFRRLGAYTDAEDLVQDTFLRVFRYRSRYVPSAKFTTFLYTLARNAWADRWRKKQRQERLAERIENEPLGFNGKDSPAAGARLDVQEALRGLPEKLSLVLVMSHYQGLNYEEIAQALNIPVGTVKSRVFLALHRLRKVFDEETS